MTGQLPAPVGSWPPAVPPWRPGPEPWPGPVRPWPGPAQPERRRHAEHPIPLLPPVQVQAADLRAGRGLSAAEALDYGLIQEIVRPGRHTGGAQ